MPNGLGTTTGRNHELVRPAEEILGYQPAVRVDYQPFQSLRVSVKYQGAIQRQQIFNGTIPGWNDSKMVHPRIGTEAVNVNYSINPTTFLEGTYGRAGNQLAACGPTPSFCNQTAVPTNDISNLNNAGLAGLPLLFPEASVLDPDYYAYSILTEASVPFFDGSRILRAPNFGWGNRVVAANNNQGAPPNINFPGFLNINTTQDVVISLTKVMGSHTMKAGFYNSHSLKRENNVQGAADNFGTLSFANDTVGTNPFDTSFGFANAAIGSFSSYAQASRYVEGSFIYNNTEWYVQDNWKANNRLTLDYGVRFVHAQPQHDKLLQSGNFLPNEWTQAEAPRLYVAGCANGVFPCSGTNRQAVRSGDAAVPRTEFDAGHRHAGAEHRQPDQWPVPVRTGHREDHLHVPEAQCRTAVRHGLRHYREAGVRRTRRRGHLLRPAPSGRRPGAGRQPSWRLAHHYDSVRPASEPELRWLDDDQPARDHGVPVRSQAPDLAAIQRRRTEAAAVGDVARRLVCRPAQLERPAAVEHQFDRSRHGLPGDDAGSDAGRGHRARVHVLCRHEPRSGARVSRLQLDGQHQPLLRRLADVPFRSSFP